jgi:hypothetical protein
MFVSVLPPVIPIFFSPGFLAVFLVGTIIRIGGHLVSLPDGFAFPLAASMTAITLVLYAGVGTVHSPAVGASFHWVHG